MKRCWQCGKELDLSGLNSKQKKAAHVCTECVRKSMTKEELEELLHPGIPSDQGSRDQEIY